MESITRRGNGVSDIRSCRWALFALFLVVLLEVGAAYPAVEVQRQLKSTSAEEVGSPEVKEEDVTKPTNSEEVDADGVKKEVIEKILHDADDFAAATVDVPTISEEEGRKPKIDSDKDEVGSDEVKEEDLTKQTNSEEVGADGVKDEDIEKILHRVAEFDASTSEVVETGSEEVKGFRQLVNLADGVAALSQDGSYKDEIVRPKTDTELMDSLKINPAAAQRAVAKLKSQLSEIRKSAEEGTGKRSMWHGVLNLDRVHRGQRVRERAKTAGIFGVVAALAAVITGATVKLTPKKNKKKRHRRILAESQVDCYFLSDPSLVTIDNPSSTSHHFCDDDMFCVLAESQDAIATCKLAAADLDLQTATLAQTVEQCQRMVYSLGLCQLPTSAAAFLSL